MSALISVGIFAAIAVVVGSAVTAHQVRKRRIEQEQQVEFANLRAVQAPKPRALLKAAAARPARAARHKVTELKSIPTEQPGEADGELVETEDPGAVEGMLVEPTQAAAPVVAGPPPPPPPVHDEPVVAAPEQERESISAPRFVSGCRAPEVPSTLLSNAATIRIDVTMLVDASGGVSSAKVVNPNPLIPDQTILDCALTQRYEPAQLPDGTRVPYPVRRRFVFKPAQA